MTAAFKQTTDEVLAGCGSELETGLEEREAKQRQVRYGPNRLRAAPRLSAWSILIEQAKSLVFLLLLLAAALSFTFSEAIQGAAILVALLLNIAVGFVTELKATRSMEALQELERIAARVRRCGEVHEISADELVPGAIVLLEAGDLVPADLRLLTVSNTSPAMF